MDGKLKILTLLSSLTALIAVSPLLNSQPGKADDKESYFSSEIDDAIAHAKRHPTNNSFVGASWYNRSTSKSFPLPKMLNTEMDSEVIEGAIGATAAGDERAAEIEEPVRQIDQGHLADNDNIEGLTPIQSAVTEPQKIEDVRSIIYIERIDYSGQEFTGSAMNIRSDVTVSAQRRLN